MQTLNATQVRCSYFGVGIKQLFRCSVPEIELYEVAGFEGAFAQTEQSGPQGLTFDESITRQQDPLWQLVAGFPRVNYGQAVRPAFPAYEHYLFPVAGHTDLRKIGNATCRGRACQSVSFAGVDVSKKK